MRAFVCEVDQTGLRRLIAEDSVTGDELRRLVSRRPPHTILWALLGDGAAEDLRAELSAGHRRYACALLLNQAAEMIPLGAAPALLLQS